MTLKTRQPTGKPAWPIMLIAGVEKSGKSYASAEASTSDLIGRTLWFGIGEDDPDELGALEGARFEIVEQDGTYRGLINTLTEAVQLGPNAKPNLLVLDSGTRLWQLLSDMAQAEANRRWKNRDANRSKPVPEDGISINMDLWNIAKQRWQHVLDLVREHQGPSIITARLEESTVMDGDKPTKDKFWKVQAEKGLPFDVGCIVEMRARGDVYLTGVRSLRFKPTEARTLYPDFTVDDLWRKLGLADNPGVRQHIRASGEESLAADDKLAADREALFAEIKAAAEAARLDLKTIAEDWQTEHGHPIGSTSDLGALELLRDDVVARSKAKEAA